MRFLTTTTIAALLLEMEMRSQSDYIHKKFDQECLAFKDFQALYICKIEGLSRPRIIYFKFKAVPRTFYTKVIVVWSCLHAPGQTTR